MYEAILESIISIIILVVYLALWLACHQKHYFRKRERFLVMAGFAMIAVSSVLDITDAWGWRRSILVIGNLDLITIIEELILYCGGVVLLAIGFGIWIRSLVGAEELHAIYRYTGDGIALADSQNRKFLRVNEPFCRLTGYTEKELLNMRVEQIHPPQESERIINLFDKANTQSSSVFMVYENQPIWTKRGWTVYCDISYGRLEINNKQYVAGFFHNVTDRRHAFEIESQLASIVRSAETAILSVDNDLNILTWNAAATRLFGYEKEEILGRPATCLIPPELVEEIYELADSVSQGNSLTPKKIQAIRKDGTSFYISFTASPISDVDGNIIGSSAVIRDMTPEVEAQAALEQEQNALKKLLEAYDRERKLISYEIHDGLAQYIGGATMQLQALMNMPEQEFKESNQILETCYSLMSRGLKETRSVINGLRPPVLDEFGVIAGIEHMACDETEAGGFAIHFTHHTSFGRLQPLLENGIFRIVQEGISNVKKHAQADSVEVEINQEDKQITIIIRDDGVGFDPDLVTPQSFGIRGIKERVRLLSGEMKINSEKGKGTQLTVTLPFFGEEPDTGIE